MAKKEAKKEQKKRRSSFGVVFWIAFILLIATVFLYNREQIAHVLQETQLVSVLRDSIGLGDAEDTPADGRSRGEGNNTDTGTDNGTDDPQAGTPQEDGAASGGGDGSMSVDESDDAEEPPRVVDVRNPSTTTPERPPDEPSRESQDNEVDGTTPEQSGRPEPEPREPERVRSSDIYFIRVTDDGKIHPHRVERKVSYVNSPMTKTLRTLIQGPTMEELNQGLLNLIPKDSELLSARVENGTAYLNFNESFRFNSMGVEGALAQLQQIVFSSTEFETVERVQILIDGQQREYLGGEGIYIGQPLTRDSFS